MSENERHSQGPSLHGSDCTCQRCLGFQPGNALALKHGAYMSAGRLRLTERHQEPVAALTEDVPCYTPADAVAVDLLSLTLDRVERSAAALQRVDVLPALMDTIELETDEGRLVVRWQPGVASALDSAAIAEGREVGSASVLLAGEPVPFSEPFWFAVAAFRPDIEIID